jgi:hypothetical protein
MWLGPDHRARSTFTYTRLGRIGNDTRALTMLRSGRSCRARGPVVWAAMIELLQATAPAIGRSRGNNRRAQVVLKVHVEHVASGVLSGRNLRAIKRAGIKMTPSWPTQSSFRERPAVI